MSGDNQTSGFTLAWLIGCLSYQNGWGFNPNPDYNPEEFYDYVNGFEFGRIYTLSDET